MVYITQLDLEFEEAGQTFFWVPFIKISVWTKKCNAVPLNTSDKSLYINLVFAIRLLEVKFNFYYF